MYTYTHATPQARAYFNRVWLQTRARRGMLPPLQILDPPLGHLTDPYQVGRDPPEGNAYKLRVRQEAFSVKCPSCHDILSKSVNGDSSAFKHALSYYISITQRISSSV